MVEMLKMSWLRLGSRSHRTQTAGNVRTGSSGDLLRRFVAVFKESFNGEKREISVAENRDALIAIQWFVAIGTSYLTLASQVWSLESPLPMLLVFVCLISAPLLQRVPLEYFAARQVESKLLILNSILILAAIGLTQSAPWDLLVLFFFCVFIAATGENLMHIVVGCTLLSIVFLVFITSKQVDLSTVDPELLIRVPFMLGISVLYGHLTSQVKKEKRRIEQMKETEELKRQLVCALAHDVKAPLSVILGHAELLAGSFGGRPDPADQASSLQCIRQNTERIVNLVTGFLDVSKLVAPKGESSKIPVDINAIVRDVMRQQTATLRKKNFNVRLELAEDLKPCRGDQNQLERVFWNLIDNAIKFTAEGGTITVTSRMEGQNISMSISDSGIGIPKEELSSLFQEFKRLKGSANIEGAGLGLFIVKTILDSHDGTIKVESKEGAGTKFTVLLPARH